MHSSPKGHLPSRLLLAVLALAGLFLAPAPRASAQVKGVVESIGFGKSYRPDCWTPMLVNLTSELDRPQEYQIQVIQEDLDRDRVVFSRQVTLNAKAQEKFWVYFLPRPTDGGLPDAMVGSRTSPGDLEKAVAVWVCTKSGGERLVKLSTQPLTIASVDPKVNMIDATGGRRLVLYVIDESGDSKPAFRDFDQAVGMMERPDFIPVNVRDLPENVIGYQAVDAVVWMNADAGQLSAGGSRRFTALEQYVRQGGRLVVTQPNLADRVEALAALLPVDVKEMRDSPDLKNLRELAAFRGTRMADAPGMTGGGAGRTGRRGGFPPGLMGDADADAAGVGRDLVAQQRLLWNQVEQKGPFRMGYATAKPDAVVELWKWWDKDGKDQSPYLARRPYGLGAVTWVAQDFGSPTITGYGSSGWPYAWDAVLGLRDREMRVKEEQPDGFRDRFVADAIADLGGSLLRGMEHEGRAGSYIALAVLFFIAYWIFAGPGSYLFLANKNKRQLSWMIFAVSALGATLLTVAVVRLVLRGRAAAHHVTFVRAVPATGADGKPALSAVIDSRVGLYIPASTRQRVALTGYDPQAVSYLTPFAIHPAHLGDSEAGFSDKAEYVIPVRDDGSSRVEVAIPYRSTLKKLQARWVGTLSGGVTGSAFLANPSNPVLVGNVPYSTQIGGRLTNNTGVDLQDVYFAFNHPQSFGTLDRPDWLLYVPAWKAGAAIDLAKEFKEAFTIRNVDNSGLSNLATPGEGKSVKGLISSPSGVAWDRYWYERMGRRFNDGLYDDSAEPVRHSLPMLSLFDRIIPTAKKQGFGTDKRTELVRRGGRELDMSELVAAGDLVVLAQAASASGAAGGDSPLPFPLEVEGDRVEGAGTTFYQFALPLLDPSNLRPQPTTQPSEGESGDDGAQKPQQQVGAGGEWRQLLK